jgi:arabinan endo-1,5-alpha-L-arabinosidase
MRAALLFFSACAFASFAHAGENTLTGELSAHDPSTIVKDKGQYWVYVTGDGIRSRHSKDLVSWEAGPPVFTNPPAWTTTTVPGFRGHFWAPDVIRLRNTYYLYYSVSTWGSQTSAIGLATNTTLDPTDAAYHWVDAGIVIQSSPKNDFNTIDPSVMLDSSGKLWLAFGSYWSGIKLIGLDPATGHRLGTNAPVPLAWKEAIEAACLAEHDGYYYLFVNWGRCCRGVESTYNIRVGRSRSTAGPFVDKDGVELLRGGGSLFLGTEARFIGPGHFGVLEKDGSLLFSHHFYDGNNHGARTLGIRPFGWGANGWPEAQ